MRSSGVACWRALSLSLSQSLGFSSFQRGSRESEDLGWRCRRFSLPPSSSTKRKKERKKNKNLIIIIKFSLPPKTHRSAAPALLPSTRSVFQSFSSRISARIRARLGPEAGLFCLKWFFFSFFGSRSRKRGE